MKKIKLIFLSLIVIGIVTCHVSQAQTSSPKAKQPKKAASIPKIASNNQEQVLVIPQETVAISRDSLSRLKAILVVGFLQESTQETVKQMKEVATYLQSLGVHVTEFYPPNDNWSAIIRASKGTDIFIYFGHGTLMGENGSAGGFYFSKEVFVSSESIANELKLSKNALVLFHGVCWSAGSTAYDETDIGVREATQRVSDYAHPFVDLQVGGYFADNYDHTTICFLRAFFNRKNIKQIYEEATSSQHIHIEKMEKYTYNSKYEVGVSSNFYKDVYYTQTTIINGKKKIRKIPPFKTYDVAYVGIPSFCVKDLFSGTIITESPIATVPVQIPVEVEKLVKIDVKKVKSDLVNKLYSMNIPFSNYYAKRNNAMEKASTLHSEYMGSTKQLTHDESKKKRKYYGEDIDSRMVKATHGFYLLKKHKYKLVERIAKIEVNACDLDIQKLGLDIQNQLGQEPLLIANKVDVGYGVYLKRNKNNLTFYITRIIGYKQTKITVSNATIVSPSNRGSLKNYVYPQYEYKPNGAFNWGSNWNKVIQNHWEHYYESHPNKPVVNVESLERL